MNGDESCPIVIDNGSSMFKIDFAGSETPNFVFPTVVGRGKYDHCMTGYHPLRCGNDVMSQLVLLITDYPIKNGCITNWGEMEKIIHYALYEQLKVDPMDHPILITEAQTDPRINRDKIVEIMFECFNVPSLYFGNQPVLSLYSSGRTSGIVLDVGDSFTHAVPIFDGYPISNAASSFNMAGNDLTNWLQKMTKIKKHEVVRVIKEKFCYVAFNYDSEIEKVKSSSYDCSASYSILNNEITIKEERFICPEFLFKPQMNGYFFDGIHKFLFKTINKCDFNVHDELYSNIVLCGGTTMCNGFAERFSKEITNLAAPKMKVNVISHPERKYAAWIGGSILASSSYFSQIAITENKYREYGSYVFY